ncbi:Wadjet anti-phage system protein JetD domain-containing protein [Desulfosarcina ovata]|uniref:Wadjet protein JetD C-terminal domain-containing protein n=1 Tax=Desulfosarcina ovata subsp. ovata TaxID=2752305 RepID=A0A5K8A486_9BACT|nr:DUF3322 and DUF2220 domain-containing protein [Desulfosarcina ovata]BBO87100.1 hypothetical protein DSCOOX_02800 [Desulfosarcina ovata subsp. ovata]
MITQAQLRKKALVPWNSGAFLAGCITGASLFPLEVRFRTPAGREILEKFDQVRAWIQTLVGHSAASGHGGYTIVWQTIRHRSLGEQQIPRQILFETSDGWLAYVEKQAECNTFLELVDQTQSVLPGLLAYLADAPLKALGHAAAWPQILTVCRWFRDHPRPTRYIRQLDIPGVDTKFIEAHKALLMDLLPRILPPQGLDATISGMSKHGFERKFGLYYDPPLVRLRLLDPALVSAGFADLTVPLADLARNDMGARNVFITENKINGLAFPPVAGALVIFGLGYGVDMLPEIPWLANRKIFYWGDIDTHGFAILSQIRRHLPQVQSILMDRRTLLDHRPLWGNESAVKRHTGRLTHLTSEEAALYEDLINNCLGTNLRLEQERIRFSALLEALSPID